MVAKTVEVSALGAAGSVRVGLWLQRLLWAAWIPLTLYTIFFAPMPDVHNSMHPLRHSSTVVQCH